MGTDVDIVVVAHRITDCALRDDPIFTPTQSALDWHDTDWVTPWDVMACRCGHSRIGHQRGRWDTRCGCCVCPQFRKRHLWHVLFKRWRDG